MNDRPTERPASITEAAHSPATAARRTADYRGAATVDDSYLFACGSAGEDSTKGRVMDIAKVAQIEGLIEIGRKAIEDCAVEFRDSRLSVLNCGNGIVIRERDGKPSDIIRIATRDAVRIALRAIAKHIADTTPVDTASPSSQ